MTLRTVDDLLENGVAGDWAFAPDDAKLYLRVPIDPDHPMGDFVGLPIGGAGKGYPAWNWDGNREAPTLTPSINVIGVWHGYLRAGKLETAA